MSVTTDQIVEEPCEVKISSTVLKTSRRGDRPAEFIKLSKDRRNITFSDGFEAGTFKMWGGGLTRKKIGQAYLERVPVCADKLTDEGVAGFQLGK